MVSALESVADIVPCIECGADDFLTKPVEFALLKARIGSCLERKQMREREFGQFFTPELARHLLRHPELLQTGCDATVTVLFCDIRGFSRISERLSPSDTVRWLSSVMGELSECVIKHQGVLVDFVGDELMAMWGAPETSSNHADRACRAALDMLACLPSIDTEWSSLVGEPIKVGIGLNTGIARVGNTGSSRKLKYGPLGNTVNLASRIQGATKYLKSELLITDSTRKALKGNFPLRRLCKVRVVNIDRHVELYELRSDAGTVDFGFFNRYEEALELFEQGRLRQAASVLGNLLVENPGDGPTLLLMSRIVEQLLQEKEDIDMVWELPGK